MIDQFDHRAIARALALAKPTAQHDLTMDNMFLLQSAYQHVCHTMATFLEADAQGYTPKIRFDRDSFLAECKVTVDNSVSGDKNEK